MRCDGFVSNQYDDFVYSKKFGDGIHVYLLLYVHVLISTKNTIETKTLKRLNIEFKMKVLDAAKNIMDIKIR